MEENPPIEIEHAPSGDVLGSIVKAVEKAIERPIVLIEEFQGEGRVDPASLQTEDKLIIVCSPEEGRRIQKTLEATPELARNNIETVSDIDKIDQASADIMISSHQVSYGAQTELRPIGRQVLDFLHELSAIVKLPVVAQLRGFTPQRYGVRYHELENTHNGRVKEVIGNIETRLELSKQNGKLIFSFGHFPPNSKFHRYDARKALSGEIVVTIDEIQSIVAQAKGRIDYIAFGSYDISSPSRILGAGTNLFLSIIGKLPIISIEKIVNIISRYTMPATHKLAKAGREALKLYTPEQLNDLIESGRFNEVIGQNFVASRTDAEPLIIT